MSDAPSREVLVFNAALQLPVNERAGYLSESCRDDAGLLRRVAALLEAHERAGTFLRAPIDKSNGSSGTSGPGKSKNGRSELEPPGERCGDHVGRYKLLQQIGEGG